SHAPSCRTHPYVASSTTCGLSPHDATCRASSNGSLSIRSAGPSRCPSGVNPHDHAAPPVQVYTHKLTAVILVHKGTPSSWYVVTTPGKPPTRVTVTRSGGPAPTSHQAELSAFGGCRGRRRGEAT